ncbi:MAG: DNA recombination protein RmuC [Planctomycetota bacterium]
MNEVLLFLLIALNIALIVLVVILLTRHSTNTNAQERTERVVKEEICQNRKEISESLQSGLDRFLKLLNTQLESVQRGLGEMQSLASGVGDLKKVLTNVKTRGTLGEIQLGALLEQILTPEQYANNVVTKKGSNDRVEFAIKLPGRDSKDVVWLPIDAKFPMEDYQKLLDAQEMANVPLVDETGKMLEARIKSEAKDIRNKYLDPPHTVDFGILFLPIEGLYAEVLRRPGLFELLQRDYHVTIAGPTTLAAILNSLQIGFRTLAIEKRSGEVWAILGTIKTEFAKFGEILDKAQKKVQEAGNIIEDASRKSRTIDRKLRNVQTLPAQDTVINLAQEPEEADENQQGLIQ